MFEIHSQLVPGDRPRYLRKPLARIRVALVCAAAMGGMALYPTLVRAQTVGPGEQKDSRLSALSGMVRDSSGAPLNEVQLSLTPAEGPHQSRMVRSDPGGAFRFTNIPAGRFVLVVRYIGYEAVRREIVVRPRAETRLDLVLKVRAVGLGAVEVVADQIVETVEASGFSVEAVDITPLANQSLDINTVLNRTTGVRVRQSGGAGSEFQYQLQGLSGRSVRFFVDGVPVDVFGTSYSIANFPLSLVDRVEVYKGVVPVDLGADALGGAVNLVTRSKRGNHLEATYGIGSFGTQQSALHVSSRRANGVTLMASGFLTRSNNDYEVWGPGVTVADENFRPVPIRARRFNDAFRVATGKLDVGGTDVPWADRALVGLVLSDLERGLQHGQTMSNVFGSADYAERLVMPTLTFEKAGLLHPSLDLRAFASYSAREGTTTDTARAQYNWRGHVIATANSPGELRRGGGGSRYTLEEQAGLARLHLRYALTPHHALGLNTVVTDVNRRGRDPLAAWWTVPFREPQSLRKSVSGLTLESDWRGEQLVSSVFIKHYGYDATVNDDVLTVDSTGRQVSVAKPVTNQLNNLGVGLALRHRLSEQVLVKFSAEDSRRLPDAEEALGNGYTILNAPTLRPERSVNVNAGAQLGLPLGGARSVSVGISGFLRHTDDLILLTVVDGNGSGQYQNIAKTGGWGAEAEAALRAGESWEASIQASYLDVRNRQRLTGAGVPNAVYNDRLRNTPWFFGNVNVTRRMQNLFGTGSRGSTYWNAGYVHEFFLNWPSIGQSTSKATIPTQLLHDLGASITMAGDRMAIGVDVLNVFDAQAYDNYLLQRPGRSIAVKIRATR